MNKPPRVDMTVIIVAALASLPPTIASIAALMISFQTNAKVEQVHVATNSMKDALVKATRESSLQEGHAEGVKDEKIRATEAKEQKK